MNRVLSYSRIAGICFPLIMLLQVVLTILRKHNPYMSVAIHIATYALWIVFFVLVIRASAKRSPIITPSWIAIGAFATGLAANCLSSYGSIMLLHATDNWESISTMYTASSIMYYVYSIAVAVAFIWLSKYFPKRSVLRTLCIIIGAVAILIQISNITIHPWKIEDESVRIIAQIGLSVFWSLCAYIPPTLFFLKFSKL